MAEPFGVAAGTVGIATVFTACVDCFGYVQYGRHFGRDFQTDLLALDCARLRLTRWGQAVNIYDPKLGMPDAPPSQIQTVKNTLHQILVLFADSEKISRKYKLESSGSNYLSVLAPHDMDPSVLALSNKMKELAVKRQKGASVLKISSWALYHRSELKHLVSGITSLIDNIENIFPVPEPKIELAFVKQETAEIQDKQALGLVEEAAQGVDSLLQAAAKEARTGHHYLNVVIKGKAQTGDTFSSDWKRGAQIGDTFSSDWKGEAGGIYHTYDVVVVEETGKVLIGNKYGGRDFWDE